MSSTKMARGYSVLTITLLLTHTRPQVLEFGEFVEMVCTSRHLATCVCYGHEWGEVCTSRILVVYEMVIVSVLRVF